MRRRSLLNLEKTSLLMFIDKFDFKYEDREEFINDPLGMNSTKFTYSGNTIQIDNKTYYLWNINWNDSIYGVTDTINYTELYNLSILLNYSNEFISFYGYLRKDNLSIYEKGNGKSQSLVKVENTSPMKLWVDCFESREYWAHEWGYGWDSSTWFDFVENYASDPYPYQGNIYSYTGKTIVWNGSRYYLWSLVDTGNSGYNETIQYMLTTTADYNYLYKKSLGPKKYFPGVAILNEDYSLSYDKEYFIYNNYCLITVKKEVMMNLCIWFDDFSGWNTYSSKDEYAQAEPGYTLWNDYIRDYLNDLEGFGGNKFILKQEFTWNGNTYYLWENAFLYGEEPFMKYMLTDHADYAYFYTRSMEYNNNNEFCPYVALLNEDKEIYRERNSDDWLLKIEYY